MRKIKRRIVGSVGEAFWVCSIVFITMCLVGCGRTQKGTKRITQGSPVSYLRGGTVTLARGTLPNNAYFSIAAVEYKFQGKRYSKLKYHVTESEQDGTMSIPGSGNIDMGRGEYGPLEIEVLLGCVNGDRYMLAYGMLRNSRDVVKITGYSGALSFTKVAIPSRFKPEGILVYAVFDERARHIVTLSPSGRVVAIMPVGRVGAGESVISEACR